MLQARNLSLSYTRQSLHVQAIDDVSLDLDAGQLLVVRGPSGCGKSTLLALLGCMLRPDSGSLSIARIQPYAMRASARARFRAAHIGFVFQTMHLLPYLDLVHNVALAARKDEHAMETARQLLQDFGLENRLRHKPDQLSVGERQRVALARALIHRPALLLADEPTGNLDPANTQRVLQGLDEFRKQGGAVILATHEQQLDLQPDFELRLNEGRAICADTLEG